MVGPWVAKGNDGTGRTTGILDLCCIPSITTIGKPEDTGAPLEYKKAPRLNPGSICVPLHWGDRVDSVDHIAAKCKPALQATKEKNSKNRKAMDGRIHHCCSRNRVNEMMVTQGWSFGFVVAESMLGTVVMGIVASE